MRSIYFNSAFQNYTQPCDASAHHIVASILPFLFSYTALFFGGVFFCFFLYLDIGIGVFIGSHER